MQLRLRSHQNFYEIFTCKQFLPTSAGNVQEQLHFRDDQQRAFGISNICNYGSLHLGQIWKATFDKHLHRSERRNLKELLNYS